MKPSLEQQIAWVQSLHNDHVTAVQKRGDAPGEGTLMIAAILESLQSAQPLSSQDTTAVVTKMHALCCEIDKFPDFDDLGIEQVKVRSALLRDIEQKARDVMNDLLAQWRKSKPDTATDISPTVPAEDHGVGGKP